ncbi:MAG TPA: 50S ribosomal protein L3 N(5)-glutamine methyltransferase [Ramlibacter sp.]|uniref:50S ribosomal protein L3 N(5)-glutamine methyltransferase n=1 Tax=Ramlibacter sp. TaxID=1917967 RepID=UPI002BD3A209|nr:50S ribosomal protein L3 N(5)-glutamine methyltransferase [Ramlibacter sp.]HVZ43684.1 50S ribosomal protein L3 N(5)-glutamine methyltransferase [Ramlibacter sp.]
MTLIEVVEAAARKLELGGVVFGHGTTNAFDEAAWLALWKLGLPLDALDESAERNVSAVERGAIDMLVERRIRTRLPAAYLTQEAWLQGVPFHVDERTIVPRSFIAEVLAAGSIDPWLPGEASRVLDLCTGGGSLAVLAAMAFPHAQVDASDLSEDALEVARINVVRHGMEDRIRLVRSDGLDALTGPYDLVLCNPPYVNARSMSSLPMEYRAEPRIALAGGLDGMDFIRRLMTDVPRRLADHGVLVLEIGNERGHFEAAFPQLQVVWLETSAGEDQVLLLTKEALR